MKNVLFALIAILATATVSSCKKDRTICVDERDVILTDDSTGEKTVVRERLTRYCDEAPGGGAGWSTTGGGGTTGGNGGWNGGGGTPSTGGAPGTYTNPIQDLSVVHVGRYDFYVNDPSLSVLKGVGDAVKSKLILPDINQDGSLDMSLGGINRGYAYVAGAIIVNGFYYQVEAVVPLSSFNTNGSLRNIQNGNIIPNSVFYSNKPFGYAGNPFQNITNHDGSFMISPAAKRYYCLLQ